jgi:hypothetical protein
MRETTKRRNAKLLPDLPARSRLSISLIDRTLSNQKIRRKLSQRFQQAKIGGMMEHGNPGHTMTSDRSPSPPFTAPGIRQTVAG